jgi:hypothetical protein
MDFVADKEEIGVLHEATRRCLGDSEITSDIQRAMEGSVPLSDVQQKFDGLPTLYRDDIRDSAIEIAKNRLPYFRRLAGV